MLSLAGIAWEIFRSTVLQAYSYYTMGSRRLEHWFGLV
jgi:hypothetical protein